MKRLTVTSALLSFALAASIGCAKEKQDATMAEPVPAPAAAAAKAEPAATTAPTPTAMVDDAKMAKLLVLKFHHDS